MMRWLACISSLGGCTRSCSRCPQPHRTHSPPPCSRARPQSASEFPPFPQNPASQLPSALALYLCPPTCTVYHQPQPAGRHPRPCLRPQHHTIVPIHPSAVFLPAWCPPVPSSCTPRPTHLLYGLTRALTACPPVCHYWLPPLRPLPFMLCCFHNVPIKFNPPRSRTLQFVPLPCPPGHALCACCNTGSDRLLGKGLRSVACIGVGSPARPGIPVKQHWPGVSVQAVVKKDYVWETCWAGWGRQQPREAVKAP